LRARLISGVSRGTYGGSATFHVMSSALQMSDTVERESLKLFAANACRIACETNAAIASLVDRLSSART